MLKMSASLYQLAGLVAVTAFAQNNVAPSVNSIEGTVLNDRTGLPLPRAHVVLSPAQAGLSPVAADADDADAVSATGDLHRIPVEFLRGDECGIADPFAQATGLAKAAGGEFLLSPVPGSVYPGGTVDDGTGSAIEALCIAGGGDHGGDGGVSVSLPDAIERACGAGD